MWKNCITYHNSRSSCLGCGIFWRSTERDTSLMNTGRFYWQPLLWERRFPSMGEECFAAIAAGCRTRCLFLAAERNKAPSQENHHQFQKFWWEAILYGSNTRRATKVNNCHVRTGPPSGTHRVHRCFAAYFLISMFLLHQYENNHESLLWWIATQILTWIERFAS